MKRVLNNQPDATPCGSTDNRKRNKTANLLHPFKNGAGKLLLTLSLLLASVGAWAQWTDSHGVTFTATSGSNGGNNAGEAYDKACDGRTDTKFCDNFVNGSCWVIVRASQPIKLTGYSLYTANDTEGNPGRNPRTWTIEGSNDGTNWHTFVTENNNATMGATNYTEYFFTCSAPDYYRYFRLTITGLQNGTLFQYSEFHPFGVVEGAGMESSVRDGYVMFSGSNYLDNSTAGTTTFNPSTCIWRGTSGEPFFNGTNYIRNNTGIIGTNNDRKCTLGGTESGTTGQTLYTSTYYLRYNNGWTRSTSTTASGRNVVFAVTKDVYSEISTAPTISGADVFDAIGNKTYSRTNASFTQGCIDYIFYNNTHHYFKTDNSTSLNAKPTAESFTYTWSLHNENGTAYTGANVSVDNGVVDYKTFFANDTRLILRLTATSTNKTFTADKTITFSSKQPTTLTFANASPTITADGWGIQLPAVTLKANETTVTGRTITYSGTGCNVSNNGTVTGIQDAGATITATFAGDDTYAASSATYIITGTNHAALNETIIGSIAITPATADLDLGGAQEYSIPASVSATTRTCELYKEFACPTGAFYSYASNNNWQYTLTKPTVNENTGATVNLTRVNWTYSGGQGQYFQPTATNNKVTLTRTDQKTDHNQEFTITANATYGSADKTATATVVILKTVVDITQLNAGTAISLQYGENESLDGHFSWQPNYESAGETYKNFTYTSQDVNVAIVDANGNVTASGPGSTKITVQSKKQDGTNGPSCEVTVNVTLDAPVISIDAAGKVTITHPSDGVTIRYTSGANPADPTATSTVYNSNNPPTLTNEQYVKAIAVVNGKASSVAQKQYITSEANGTKVILNDYEDHNWTYYSGVEIGDYNTKNEYKGRLYSPNPRNVKITYLGKGKMHTGNDNSSLIDVPSTTRVSVGLGTETENVFVYYKTLERNANNRYEYTTIPNPFQVRPTYASDNTTKWRGFRYWRIKSISNGNIYAAATGGTALTEGATLNAETTYYFVPNDANGTGYTPNCTSMEIELEAVWARAYVNNNQNVGFERNFRVITANSDNAPTKYDYPTTYSSIYPNGCTTADGTTLATGARYRVGANLTIDNDTKFEYIILRNINNNNTLDAACHNLVIGRGVVGYNNGLCATEIRGNAASNMDFTLRIESGSYTTFHALKSGGGTFSGICKVRSVLGCDYDRAKNDNSKLNISTNMWMGQSCQFSTANNRTQGFYKCWIKSGNLLSGVIVNGSAGNDGNGGTKTFYYGTSGSQGSTRHLFPRYLYMEGGQIAGLAGGLDDRTVTGYDEMRVYLKMTGGYVRGPIYGAGAYAPASGCRNYILVGGEVGGWVAAGCNGIGESTEQGGNDGSTTGTSYVYIGGDVAIGYKGALINSVEGGNVFGAGRGASGKDYQVGTMINSNVVVADNARIEKNVYGGGNYGLTTENATIYIAGGTVDGNVFGGSNMKEGKTPTIYMTDGLVKSGIFGGSNTQGTISQNVTIRIEGGQVGTESANGNVHGGGKGSATVVNGNVNVTIGGTTAKQPVIYGDVYGGSESGYVNGDSYSAGNTNTTSVTLNNGVINGSLYGGAWGKDQEAFVFGPVSVTVNGGTVTESVFGCNNAQGKPRMGVSVTINHTDPAPSEGQYALKNVFGGGNRADYTAGTPIVTVNNCDNSIEYVYGGGNMATVPGTNVTIHGGNVIGNVFGGGYGADITTNGTHVTIDGGRILNVFGGSNNGGVITGSIVVDVNESNANQTACPIDIDNLYGGGNKAASAAGQLNIGCCSHIGNVYGGANQANITGNINLLITGGNIDNVFGGNNTSGNINGTITVTVDWEGSCTKSLRNVYGGGNKAAYSAPNSDGKNWPKVNIRNAVIEESVFGGGLGESALVTGNPQVTVSTECTTQGHTNDHMVRIKGSLYGGGSAAPVTGNPVVTTRGLAVDTQKVQIDNHVFGGGLGQTAVVTGNTEVNIKGNTVVNKNVYGGGNGGEVTGNTNIVIGDE